MGLEKWSFPGGSGVYGAGGGLVEGGVEIGSQAGLLGGIEEAK